MTFKRICVLLSCLLLSLSLAACQAMKDIPVPWEDGGADGSHDPAVFYVDTDGLRLMAEPSSSSVVLQRLDIGAKVVRSKLSKGWAYVKVSSGGQKGWVNNSRLDWRKPADEPAPEPKQKADKKSSTGQAHAAPAPEPSKSGTAEPAPVKPEENGKPDASIFDAL